MSRTLMVLPDDSAQPIIDAINGATRSIRIKMFAFTHPLLIEAVLGAHRRGVKVRVMLNPARRSGKQDNEATRELLVAAGIDVIDSNPKFDLTHEKSMVIDDSIACIKSLNWETKSFIRTRDYAVITHQQHEVDEIIECFEADWHRTEFNANDHHHLVWCVGNGRQRLCDLIDQSRHTLFLQNERYQDPVIIEHLVRAARRGVQVHVMARPPHKLKREKISEGVSGLRILEDVGIKIHRLRHIKLHAKLLLADSGRAIVGSINLAPGSFDSRRELAIEVRDEHIIRRLDQTLHQDWGNSKRLDLSDQALIKELQRVNKSCAEDLGFRSLVK